MKRELRDRWVEALRSGDYEQGQSFLRNGNKFCCLGVLCEVAGVPREDTEWGSGYRLSADEWEDVDLPPRWGGLTPRVKQTLMDKNDLYGKSFLEIADHIERYVKVED